MKRLVLSQWAMRREMKGMTIRRVKELYLLLYYNQIKNTVKIKLHNYILNKMINLTISIIANLNVQSSRFAFSKKSILTCRLNNY